MKGTIGILNVGAGDTKLTFDKSNPAETIRSARIVTDMLRRGYALLVEIEKPDGTKAFTRVHAFREDVAEYIIADLDPSPSQTTETDDAQSEESPTAPADTDSATAEKPRRGRKPKLKAIPAVSTRGIAIARSAGG
jgi:hypothetical protein